MSIEDRINSTLTRFAEVVGEAESQAGKTEGVRQISSGLNKLFGALGSVQQESMAGIMEILGTDQFLALGDWASKGRDIQSSLSKLAGEDRTEGDLLSQQVSMAVQWGYLEDEQAEEANSLVSRWNATAPKSSSTGSRSTGSSSVADLGFLVVATCQKCNKQVTSSNKDNLNSFRDLLRKHHGDNHGGRFGRGDAIHQGVTEAIDKVMHKGSTSVEGGGYTISRTS